MTYSDEAWNVLRTAEPKIVQVDDWSLAALQIEMYFDDTLLSHGTGSIWQAGEKNFLVTNWHNFTGKHRTTGEHLSPNNSEPTKVAVSFLDRKMGVKWHVKSFPLFDGGGKPLWHEHPNVDLFVDLAALEIELPENVFSQPPAQLPSTDLSVEIGDDMFVIGYPFKREIIGFPVWKRASLASELEMSESDGTRRFYIDTATRQGMSGSLVIRKVVGAYSDGRSAVIIRDLVSYRLMGIYSGRLGANKDGDAQLGIVWPTSLVDELIDNIKIGGAACE